MKKNITSLIVVFVFAAMAVTGLLLYIKQKSHTIEMSHTVFGLLFIVFAIFHVINNWKSIILYSTSKQSYRINKKFVLVFLAFIVILNISFTNIVEPIAEFGKIFAKSGGRPNQGISFVEKITNDSVQGKSVTLLVQKQANAMDASVAVDIVDSSNKVIEKLYTPDVAQAVPPSNLIINTKIGVAVPFVLRVSSKDKKGNATELKGVVNSLEEGVFAPINTSHSSLARLILEVH